MKPLLHRILKSHVGGVNVAHPADARDGPQTVVLHVADGHVTMRPELVLATMHSSGPHRGTRRAQSDGVPAPSRPVAVVVNTVWRFPQATKDMTIWIFT